MRSSPSSLHRSAAPGTAFHGGRLFDVFQRPVISPACEGSHWGTWQVVSSRWESGYCAVIQPVGNLIRVITPLATYPVRGNAPSTCPFPQGHWMYVDKFTQFSGGQSSVAATKVVNDVHLTLLLSLVEKRTILISFHQRLHHRCGCNRGCGNLCGLEVAERLLDCRSRFRRIQVGDAEIAHRGLDVLVSQQVLDRLNLCCA